jgi:hypothetical protein
MFVDDDGNDRRIEGVSELGRSRFVEILGRTLSLTPVDPMTPEMPVSGAIYRWDRRTGLTASPSRDGAYQIWILNNTNNLLVNDADADGQAFSAFEVGQTLAMVFTNGYTVTVTVATVDTWRGYGGQSSGPSCTFTPTIDQTELDLTDFGNLSVGVTITITS